MSFLGNLMLNLLSHRHACTVCYHVSFRKSNDRCSAVAEAASVSPFCGPLLFVLKKGGDLLMVFDYCTLLKLTIQNRYPLSRIDDLFDKLQGSQYFTSLDFYVTDFAAAQEDTFCLGFCLSEGL